ncbi:hypothetical protein Cgig2_007641 [Carnegiea gigantea]|uniref:Uncharacterized protein n=1 Tax=Carnegiea gigantea TaxID=171969 RepID=A0A9Q1Q8S3_9CARY|nr:hypothetical protein Cgig2_007641 [Carnegiea gigantea]
MEMNLFPSFGSTEQVAKYIRDDFRWVLRDPLAPGLRPLPSDYHSLYSHIDLEAVTWYARDSNIPEMVPIIFYAMVIDDAAELGLSHRLTMDCMMWSMQKLDWGPVEAWLRDNDQRLRGAQASRPVDPPANPVLVGSSSRERTIPFSSAAEYVRDNLRWSIRKTSSLCPNLLPLLFMAYCPEFDHIVRTEGGKRKMVNFPNFTSAEMAAKYVHGTLRWPQRETSAQRPRPLP